MKNIIYLLIGLISLSSCDVELTISNSTFGQQYQGIAECDDFLSLDGQILNVEIDSPFDDENVEVDLGDGLLFDGTVQFDNTIELENRTRTKRSDNSTFRLTDGVLRPEFFNSYEFTFSLSKDGGRRGRCEVDLTRI